MLKMLVIAVYLKLKMGTFQIILFLQAFDFVKAKKFVTS